MWSHSRRLEVELRRTLLALWSLGCLAVPSLASADAMYHINLDSLRWEAGVVINQPDILDSPAAFWYGFSQPPYLDPQPLDPPNGWYLESFEASLSSPSELSRSLITGQAGGPATVIDFAPGTYRVDLVLGRADSSAKVSGSYVAPTDAFSIEIRETQIGEADYCPCIEQMYVYPLDGILDRSLARALGVSRHGQSDPFWIIGERLDDAYAYDRLGVGYGSAGLTVVPEPSTVALLGLGAVGALVRRLRRHDRDAVTEGALSCLGDA